MNEMTADGFAVEELVRIPIQAYVCADYARAENEKLCPKVWQIVCREEELQNVGDCDGAMPSPCQEIPVIHFHRPLAKFMGTGAPAPLGSG